jgi:hypothetical protein
MDLRRKIEREIEKQNAAIADLKHKLTFAEAYLEAQLDMLKLLPKTVENSGKSTTLRPGGDPARVRDILREAGAPMHVSDILTKLERPLTKDSRSALSATLGTYVNRGVIFTRTAPNTFGLIEMSSDESATLEPPEGFGANSGD